MTQEYKENFLNDGVDRKWCQKIKDRRTNFHDEGGQGRKSVEKEDLAQRVYEVVRDKRRFTISGLMN